MGLANRMVLEVLQRHFVSLEAGDRLDFADQVMRLGRIRHLPVVSKGVLVGIVSNRDILAASLSKALDFARGERRTFLHAIEVSEVMTSSVYTVAQDTRLSDAARLLLQHKIGCLPVVDANGTLLGLVTETDILRAAVDEADATEPDGPEDPTGSAG